MRDQAILSEVPAVGTMASWFIGVGGLLSMKLYRCSIKGT